MSSDADEWKGDAVAEAFYFYRVMNPYFFSNLIELAIDRVQ